MWVFLFWRRYWQKLRGFWVIGEHPRHQEWKLGNLFNKSDRQEELATLKQRTVQDRCRVAAILGMGGQNCFVGEAGPRG